MTTDSHPTAKRILDRIDAVMTDNANHSYTRAGVIRELAEAYAWLVAPAAPHGSSTDVSVKSS